MIATPTNFDEPYLERFFQALMGLDYPKKDLRFVAVIGSDTPLKILRKYCNTHLASECIVFKEQKKWRPRGVSLKADIYEDLVSCIKDEEYVFFIDSDVVTLPKTLLTDLIAYDKDIIAPYVYHENTNIFYDTYIFRREGKKFPLIPPKQDELIEMDSVGTCMLAKSKVAKECPFKNPHHWLHFCYFAREKGYHIYAAPTLRIDHELLVDEPPHFSFDQQVELGYIDVNECIRRGVFSTSDLQRYEKIIGKKLQ